MKAVFIDESKSKTYVLCAVFVPLEQVPTIRKGLNKLKFKGQSRIHFVSEGNRRRKQLLTAYRTLPIEVLLIETNGRSEAESRETCLRALARQLPKGEYCEVWIETDSNHLGLDKSVLSSALMHEKKSSNVVFAHSDSRSQILLWIPDALAWIRTRGGDWHKEFRGFSIQAIKAEKS
jgi:hypothetical protein